MPSLYSFISLPLGVFESSDKDDAISSLSATVSPDNGTVLPFHLPDFKMGTLDALVQQADDLAKLESIASSVVAKVADSLQSILGPDEDRLAQYKMVNDSQSPPSPPSGFASAAALCSRFCLRLLTLRIAEPTEQYLNGFTWNKLRYRSDKPLSELIDTLQKVRSSVAPSRLDISCMVLPKMSADRTPSIGARDSRQRCQDQDKPVQLCQDEPRCATAPPDVSMILWSFHGSP